MPRAPLHRSRDEQPRTELSLHRLYAHIGSPFVAIRRAAPCDPHTAQLAHRCQQLVADAVGEILERGVVRHVPER